jgi:lactoylglutathione lyase
MTQNSSDSSSWVKSIFAISLLVEDLPKAKEFYARVFDLPVEYEDANSVVFKFGGTMINLLKTSAAVELLKPANPGRQNSGSRAVFTIHVDDVDALCAQLTARGVKLLNGPMDRPWGIRTASFLDPGGHVWEIAK